MRENISTSEDFLLVHERNGLDFGRVHLFRLVEGGVSQPYSLPFTSPPTECPARTRICTKTSTADCVSVPEGEQLYDEQDPTLFIQRHDNHVDGFSEV